MKRNCKIAVFVFIVLWIIFLPQRIYGKEVTKQELVNYIRQGYEVVGATDEILSALLDETYQGIPYFELVKALMTIDKAYTHIHDQKYGHIIGDLASATLPSLLASCGYVSIGAAASSAFRIYDSLEAFNEAVKKRAFKYQIDNYFYYRNKGDAHEDILDADFLFKTDDGWLLPTSYTGGHPRPLKPEQVYEYARWLYDLKQNPQTFEHDKKAIGEEMRKTIQAFEHEGVIGESSSLLDAILHFVGNIWDAVKRWFISQVYAKEIDYEKMITDERYSGIYPDPRVSIPVVSLVSPLRFTPTGNIYYIDDIITADFGIDNDGSTAIALRQILVGGRGPNGDNIVCDFTPKTNVILAPETCYQYQGTIKLTKPGKYHFFCFYQTQDGQSNPSIDLGPGLTNTDRIKD